MLILVIIVSISYGFTQRRTDEIESNDVTVEEQLQIVNIVSDFSLCVNDSCEPPTEQLFDIPIESSEASVLPEISVIECSDFCDDDVMETRLQQSLLCYCDGSYSNRMRIAYSGFRASDGFSDFYECPIWRPRSGSTESEVFAACLALRYTAKSHYNSMILHTDNSKVEQLFKSPKPADRKNYPDFFDALNQCRQKENYVAIQVKRVRGHTTRYEQQQCLTKHEFAKVDGHVRRKLRQHIREIYLLYERINSFYRCDIKNTRNTHTVDFSTMFIMNSIPEILSSC